TFVDAVSGFVEHSGSVLIDGGDIGALPPHRRAAAGLSRTWQSVELFDGLTVRQQCEAAIHTGSRFPVLTDLLRLRRRTASPAVDRALEMVGLTELADADPATLPAGTQKLVGVARAVASSPSVLLLDEPAAGLSTDESKALGGVLRRLADTGIAMVLIEHDADLVFDTCDRVVVLDLGSVIVDGPPSVVRQDERVRQAYLGTSDPTDSAS
ncbi:MAG: ABC transporter ATP-binding protein, partial [Actinomycetes bacterium]